MAKSEKKSEKTTPMLEQYWSMKNSLPKDTLLLFRLGDFYEMFYDDAVEGSRLLGITLTKRQNYPMAGIPYHVIDQYLPKILACNKKVAICDQNEPPVSGKLVKRSVTRIITPGTVMEDAQLDSRSGNYIFAVDIDRSRRLYAAWMEMSAGEFYCAEFDTPQDFLPVLSAFDAKEVLLPEDASREWAADPELAPWHAIFRSVLDTRTVTLLHDFRFEPGWGAAQVQDALSVASLDGFGIERGSRLAGPAGAIVFYVTENLRARPGNLRALRRFSGKKCVLVDPATQRNLEIFRSTSHSREGSLISVMDRTKTAAGARLLETFLASPTLDLDEIRARQDAVWELYSSPEEAGRLADSLSRIRDIPRILGRLQNRIRNPRELRAILETVRQIPAIRAALLEAGGGRCAEIAESLPDFSELETFLASALADDMPAKVQDGGVIRGGFDAELDRLRSLSRDNMAWLAELEQAEQKRTGIRNLRIKYNGAFGYFIEVTKANLGSVPPEYIRRQTMVNCDRFTTQELREKEREILHSQEYALAREQELFSRIVARALSFAPALAAAADILARLDVFRGWAEIAREWDYCRPVVDDSDTIEISEGRHPVVEQMLRRDRIGLARTESFVPNDAHLSSSGEQIALITGPNMAGKSTYIRQIALIALMAQTGSFVPARECRIGLVDRIFSRVGASDELARGNSTFMVEMNETANILNNSTDRSLIILDEIGRGTSTYDGLSIAWAVAEFIHGEGERGPRTLFATHYHEITKLEQTLPRLVNLHVSVREWNDEIIFTRTIEKGAADRSYGIQVARLAGLPKKVIDRAKVILAELESEGEDMLGNLGESPKPKAAAAGRKRGGSGESNFAQLSLF